MKDVWLIRHGESIANAGEATTTPREIPLSESGRKQAEELAGRLRSRPDLVIVSPYVRSQQTAEPILRIYPDISPEEFNVQEYTYLSIERCRGTSHAERKPWVAEYWQRADPTYCDGGQSESFAEFISRCRDFERRLAAAEFDLAFVFTHEQFIKGMLWDAVYPTDELDSEAMNSFQAFMVSFPVPNAAILRAKIGDDGAFYFSRIAAAETEDHA